MRPEAKHCNFQAERVHSTEDKMIVANVFEFYADFSKSTKKKLNIGNALV